MAAVLTYFSVNAQQVQQEYKLTMKTPGNPSVTYDLKESNGQLTAGQSLPLAISRNVTVNGASQRIEITIKANELAYYSLEEIYKLGSFGHDDCLFYMPGFWYRRNLRSPKEAPSWYVSDSWQVREDRLSTPLTGIYNEKTHDIILS